ncbi:hypothetical protein C8R43DRAFT_1129318 [Mycena crocata]|nr:hypothetical protein C8R43DRAFT_1129318 [Mycena crocata]
MSGSRQERERENMASETAWQELSGLLLDTSPHAPSMPPMLQNGAVMPILSAPDGAISGGCLVQAGRSQSLTHLSATGSSFATVASATVSLDTPLELIWSVSNSGRHLALMLKIMQRY